MAVPTAPATVPPGNAGAAPMPSSALGAGVTWNIGNVGALGAPKYTGQVPNRQLATLEELCTVEITAVDLSDHTDERKQYQAARELFDAWYRAVYLAAVGSFLGSAALGRTAGCVLILDALVALGELLGEEEPVREPELLDELGQPAGQPAALGPALEDAAQGALAPDDAARTAGGLEHDVRDVPPGELVGQREAASDSASFTSLVSRGGRLMVLTSSGGLAISPQTLEVEGPANLDPSEFPKSQGLADVMGEIPDPDDRDEVLARAMGVPRWVWSGVILAPMAGSAQGPSGPRPPPQLGERYERRPGAWILWTDDEIHVARDVRRP